MDLSNSGRESEDVRDCEDDIAPGVLLSTILSMYRTERGDIFSSSSDEDQEEIFPASNLDPETFVSLKKDTLIEIFSYLGITELGALSSTCKGLVTVAEDPKLWMSIFVSTWPQVGLLSGNKNWKEEMKAFERKMISQSSLYRVFETSLVCVGVKIFSTASRGKIISFQKILELCDTKISAPTTNDGNTDTVTPASPTKTVDDSLSFTFQTPHVKHIGIGLTSRQKYTTIFVTLYDVNVSTLGQICEEGRSRGGERDSGEGEDGNGGDVKYWFDGKVYGLTTEDGDEIELVLSKNKLRIKKIILCNEGSCNTNFCAYL
eukprot:TRINITY_DN10623_c0_g1_i1.p1 TRINITY_DN10623_c0_g1~~TRINITY_DN10623_c0_g1_i1.p1  ORF type:complete len:318 (-),score=66.34 TRINITY_DN10623_c0_g1_i1:575-1528(-)